MADEKLLGTKDMKSWVSSAYKRWETEEALMRAMRSDIKIEKNWAEKGALWNSAGQRG